jgi:ketosteroid isomerase-like protein
MPDRARVMEFVSTVVSGDHVGAIANFYHENATMQENRNEPRRGRDILMAHEARALSRVKRMHTYPAEVVLIDGDNVAIRWTFDRISHEGPVTRLEEVALQVWKEDRILHERFFYDTASAWFEVDASAPGSPPG